MQTNKIIAIILVVLALVFIVVGASIPTPPPVVGADGTETVGTIPWPVVISNVLKLFGFGSFSGAILAFWGKWGTTIQQVVHTVSPSVPVVGPVTTVVTDGPKIAADTAEIVAAAIAYAANRKDKSLQRRFTIASITEITDIVATQSPEVAAAANSLLIALANNWIPVEIQNPVSAGVKA